MTHINFRIHNTYPSIMALDPLQIMLNLLSASALA